MLGVGNPLPWTGGTMSRILTLAGLAGAILSVACAEPADGPVDTSAAEAGVDASLAAYRDALLAGDAETAVSYATADIRLQEPGMRIGRDELTEFLTGLFEAGVKVLEFDVRRDDLFVHDGAAYEVGEYDETVRTADGGEQTVRGNFFIRWERGGEGVWRMDRVVTGPREEPEGQ